MSTKSASCAAIVLALSVFTGLLITGTESGSNNFLDRFGEEGETSQSRFNFIDGDLLKAVGKQEVGNLVVSPASIKLLLGLVMEAAEGSTLNEIRRLLRLPNNITQARNIMSTLQTVLQKAQNGKVTVDAVTNTFVSLKHSLNTSYVKAIKDLYRTEVNSVDFTRPDNAANKINSWVASQTRGLIPSLIDPDNIDPDTMAILVSAVFFNGQWKEEFQLKDTKDECFYSEPNLGCNMVPMMFKKDELFHKYDDDFNSHILQLPYQDPRFMMVLVIPQKRDGIRQLAIDTNRLTLPGLLGNTRLREVNLKLPRFTVEFGADLKLILTQMGLNEVFSSEAQLPYMINNMQGQVSALIHKAKIEVSEKGTKAAAASGASVVPLMSGLETVNVTADHPFYFFVYEHESKSVLFSGRLSSVESSNPTAESTSENVALTPSAGQPSNVLGAGSANRPSNRPMTYRPNLQAAQNHQYVPPASNTPAHSYSRDQIHFPTSSSSPVSRNLLKYFQTKAET